MRTYVKHFLFCLIISFSFFSYSQIEEVNPPDYIKTITFKSNNSEQGEIPIIKLNDPF